MNLFLLYSKEHLDLVPKNSVVVCLNPAIEKELKHLKIPYKSKIDYVGRRPHCNKDATFFLLNWAKENKNLSNYFIYENLSLIDLANSSFYFNFFDKLFENIYTINKIIEKEKPSKIIIPDNKEMGGITATIASSKKIPFLFLKKYKKDPIEQLRPSLIKYFFKLRELQRRHSKKKTDKKTKILMIATGKNSVDVLTPVIKKLKDTTVIRIETLKDNSTKATLEKANIPYKTYETYITKEINKKVKRVAKLFNKKFDILRKSKKFQNSFVYKNILVYSLIEPAFSYFSKRKRFIEIIKQIEITKKILEKEKPKIIILTEDINPVNRVFTRLAKLKKIKTLVIQHGAVDYHPMGPRTVADKIAVWGKTSKEFLEKNKIKKEKIVITGSSKYDPLVNKKFKNKDLIYGQLKIPKKFGLIILATQLPGWTEEANKNLLYVVYKAMKKFPDQKLVVKMHPSNFSNLPYKIAKETKTNPVIIKDIDHYSLIKAANALITISSSIAFETMILKKPIIITNLNKEADPTPYVKEGVAFGVYNEKDLPKAIEKVLNKEGTEDMLKRQKKFIYNYLYKVDGKSTDRVINLINKMMEK